MEHIFNIAESIGTDVRSRAAADSIMKALQSQLPPEELSFAGVEFISRSFTDQLCIILEQFPAVSVTGMSKPVETMFDIVKKSRQSTRVRHSEDSSIKNFSNVKDFFAFMRNQ